jgi:hypothetical protein
MPYRQHDGAYRMPIRRLLRPASTGVEDRPAYSHRKSARPLALQGWTQARLSIAALRVMAKNKQKKHWPFSQIPPFIPALGIGEERNEILCGATATGETPIILPVPAGSDSH